MQRWYTGQYLTNVYTGREYVVTEICMVVESNSPTKEEYTVMDLKTGAVGKIWENGFNSYVKSNGTSGQILQTDGAGVPVWVDAPFDWGFYNNTVPTLTNGNIKTDSDGKLLHDDADILVTHGDPSACSHDWVTWTGLRGTITDCTKCKAKK